MSEGSRHVDPLAVNADSGTTSSVNAEVTASENASSRDANFWAIFASLSLLAFISALDTMIIATALPTIVKEIGGAAQSLWIANSFVFASSVVQPLFGQLADTLGRKLPMIACVVLFMLGSGIAGGASGPGMLIGGRTVQGVGAGGIYVLIDIVACDLVSLRERGKYLALVNSSAGVAAALGPVLGGILAQANWRWIFYMNIPICALPLVSIVFFMHVKAGDDGIVKPRSLDLVGTAIFIPSIVAILYGLVTGGVLEPWSSWRVIFPLVIGFVGWICFHIHQHWATQPSMPSRLFSNRTSATCINKTSSPPAH